MKRQKIIELKIKGYSNRQIQKEENINRKTVSRYWQEYIKALEILEENNDDREAKEILAMEKATMYQNVKQKWKKLDLKNTLKIYYEANKKNHLN